MGSDHGLMGAVYQALSTVLRVPVFHHVPQGVLPPYVVLDLKTIGVGNGLPSPHFQTRGAIEVRVWSAYEGVAQLSDLLGQVSRVFAGRRLELPEGWAWFEVQEMTLEMPQHAQPKNAWRAGSVGLRLIVER